MSTSADNKASVHQEKKILLRTADGEVFELIRLVSDRIKNKSVEHIRELFGVENDFRPDEYEEVCAGIPSWCYEGVDDD